MKVFAKYERENLSDLLSELPKLAVEHWNEVDYLNGKRFLPNTHKYLTLEKGGALKVFTARDEKNELIGYAMFFVLESMHSRGSVQAVNDMIFIRKGYRGIGVNFLKHCDNELTKLGVDVILMTLRKDTKALKRLGYELKDFTYIKRLS